MKIIRTTNAPLPAGHYSQAIEAGDFIFVSGQLPFEPFTRTLVSGGIHNQVIQCLENIEAILAESGLNRNHIVKTTAFISDINLWNFANQAYIEFFGDHFPARTVVPTRELHYGAMVEIEAVAIKN